MVRTVIRREACPDCQSGNATVYTKSWHLSPGVDRIYDCQDCGRLFRQGEGVK